MENNTTIINEEVINENVETLEDTEVLCDEVYEEESKSNIGAVAGLATLVIGGGLLIKKAVKKHQAKKAQAEADKTEVTEEPQAPKFRWKLRSPFEKVEVTTDNTVESEVTTKEEVEAPKPKKVRKSKKTEA